MSFINVNLIEGFFSDPPKKQIVTKLTEAMASIDGENTRAVTWVVIEEVKGGDWAIDGMALCTADVESPVAARAAQLV